MTIKFYFHAPNLAFYRSDLNETIPPGAVEITEEAKQDLFAGLASGKAIAADPHGKPILVDHPPPGPPQMVSMRQARLALLAAGLLAQVDPAIASLPSPEREAVQIEWEYATEVYRDSPAIALLGTALGMTGEQIDDLFIAATAL